MFVNIFVLHSYQLCYEIWYSSSLGYRIDDNHSNTISKLLRYHSGLMRRANFFFNGNVTFCILSHIQRFDVVGANCNQKTDTLYYSISSPSRFYILPVNHTNHIRQPKNQIMQWVWRSRSVHQCTIILRYVSGCLNSG